jgi:hypothetical protein
VVRDSDPTCDLTMTCAPIVDKVVNPCAVYQLPWEHEYECYTANLTVNVTTVSRLNASDGGLVSLRLEAPQMSSALPGDGGNRQWK